MKLVSITALVLLLAVGSMGQATGDCGHWNGPATGSGVTVSPSDPTQHVSGAHVLNAAHTGSCVYTCPNGVQCVPNTQCIATVYSYNAATGEDTGTVTGSAHVLKFASASSNNTNNGQVTAPASAAENAAVCFNTSCNVSISVTAADRIRVTSIAGREFWMPMWWRPFTLVTTGAFGGGALVYLAVLIFSR